MQTLKSYHKIKLESYEKLKKNNEKTEKKIKSLKRELNKLEKESFSEMSEEEIHIFYNLKEQIKTLESSIKNPEEEKNKYLIDVFNCLKDYHSTEDFNKKFDNQTNQKNILDFGLTLNNKKDIFDKFLEKVDKNHVSKMEYEMNFNQCPECTVQLKVDQISSLFICSECGYNRNILLESETKKYNNTIEPSNFSYKRLNHFIEWLNNIQGKNKNHLPDELVDRVNQEIKRLIIPKENINKKTLTDILKKLNLKEYLDQINFLVLRIKGQYMPKFDKALEEQLIVMFKQIQEPFEKHKPKNRSNFLNFSYCIRKFLELRSKTKYLKHIDALKSKDKLYKQDLIWKKICKELQWEFIKSV